MILLHGLARTARSMNAMARAGRGQGYAVFNIDYPSTSAPLGVLSHAHLAPAVDRVIDADATRIDFITHSMGGILLRQYLATHPLPQLGRVVMLGTPNGGSELVDKLARLAPFTWLNGPAGRQLGTGADSLPSQLGPVRYPVGIIAGTRSYNPLYSSLIEGPNDGKVSVRRAQVEGQTDLLVLPVNHTFMMRNAEVIRQSLHFLRQGRFGGEHRSHGIGAV